MANEFKLSKLILVATTLIAFGGLEIPTASAQGFHGSGRGGSAVFRQHGGGFNRGGFGGHRGRGIGIGGAVGLGVLGAVAGGVVANQYYNGYPAYSYGGPHAGYGYDVGPGGTYYGPY